MKSMDRLWTRVKNPSDDRNAAKRAILLYKIDHIWRDSYLMSSHQISGINSNIMGMGRQEVKVDLLLLSSLTSMPVWKAFNG